jgi:hypothetical protein
MKGRVSYSRWIGSAALCAAASYGFGQEALRQSLAGEDSAEARRLALERQPFNLKIGDAKALLGASLETEFNDNVRLTDTIKEEDVIFRPEVAACIQYSLSEVNALDFSMGLGYAAYVQQPDYSHMLITPGSQLAFDMYVKDFRFRIFDRFSYTQSGIDAGTISGVADLNNLQNTAGLNTTWDLNKAILTAEYGYHIFLTDDKNFEYLDRSANLFLFRAAFLPTRYVAFGAEATAAGTDYDQSTLLDSFSYSAGPYLEWRASPNVTIKPRAGYVTYDFEQRPDATTDDVSTWYARLDIQHRINQYLRHTLSGGREIVPGYYTPYYDLYFARYGVSWMINRRVTLATQLVYEHGKEPTYIYKVGSLFKYRYAGEVFDRIGGRIGVEYMLSEHLRASLGYRYILKNSDQINRDYGQNSVLLDINYQF